MMLVSANHCPRCLELKEYETVHGDATNLNIVEGMMLYCGILSRQNIVDGHHDDNCRLLASLSLLLYK